MWAEPQASCDLCKDYEGKGQRSEPQTICDLCNNLRSEDKGQGPEPQIHIHSGSLAHNATMGLNTANCRMLSLEYMIVLCVYS